MSDATLVGVNPFGSLYVIDFVIMVSEGQATVRSGWIVRAGEDFPRLTTCFVRRKA